MNNKLRYVVLSLVLSFLGMNSVFASDFVISSVVDSTSVAKGNEASIKVNLKASEAIKECLFKFESDSNIEYVSIAGANGWVPNETGLDGISITNSSWSNDVSSDGQNIAELKYKINGDGKVVIKTVQCVATVSETSYKYDDVTVSFTATEPVDDTTLSSLSVTNGTMNPSNVSSEHTGSYIITLTSPTFGLKMTASNPDYKDDVVVTDVNGNVISDVNNITYNNNDGKGSMPLTITVNGKTKYSLLVIYEKKELDNSLASVTINGKELTLVDGEYDYEYTVGKDVSEFVVAATLKDSENFKFGSKSNAPDTFTINDTVNIIIVVEPKDSSAGTKAVTYTIEVTREGSTTDKEEDKETPNNSGSTGSTGTGSSGSSTGSSNVGKNPNTADIPMFLMAFILVASLIGSIVLYRKNLEGYK